MNNVSHQWILGEGLFVWVLQRCKTRLELPDGLILCDPLLAFLRFDAGLLFLGVGHNGSSGVSKLVPSASGNHSGTGGEEKESKLVRLIARIDKKSDEGIRQVKSIESSERWRE